MRNINVILIGLFFLFSARSFAMVTQHSDRSTWIYNSVTPLPQLVVSSNGSVGIGTKNPLSNLDVVGTFRFRDAENPAKAYRYRFGGATDVEGGGADVYFSVWENGDFTGTQRNKMLMEQGKNVLQLIHEIQFRDNPQGNIYAAIYGDNGNAFFLGNVGIGTSTPTGALEISSNTQGVVLPRMTKSQRDAIAGAVAGTMIYQTDNTPGLRVYNGTNWLRFTETTD